MLRTLFTPGTATTPVPPDPLLQFIRRAQLILYYRDRRGAASGSALTATLASERAEGSARVLPAVPR